MPKRLDLSFHGRGADLRGRNTLPLHTPARIEARAKRVTSSWSRLSFFMAGLIGLLFGALYRRKSR